MYITYTKNVWIITVYSQYNIILELKYQNSPHRYNIIYKIYSSSNYFVHIVLPLDLIHWYSRYDGWEILKANYLNLFSSRYPKTISLIPLLCHAWPPYYTTQQFFAISGPICVSIWETRVTCTLINWIEYIIQLSYARDSCIIYSIQYSISTAVEMYVRRRTNINQLWV